MPKKSLTQNASTLAHDAKISAAQQPNWSNLQNVANSVEYQPSSKVSTLYPNAQAREYQALNTASQPNLAHNNSSLTAKKHELQHPHAQTHALTSLPNPTATKQGTLSAMQSNESPNQPKGNQYNVPPDSPTLEQNQQTSVPNQTNAYSAHAFNAESTMHTSVSSTVASSASAVATSPAYPVHSSLSMGSSQHNQYVPAFATSSPTQLGALPSSTQDRQGTVGISSAMGQVMSNMSSGNQGYTPTNNLPYAQAYASPISSQGIPRPASSMQQSTQAHLNQYGQGQTTYQATPQGVPTFAPSNAQIASSYAAQSAPLPYSGQATQDRMAYQATSSGFNPAQIPDHVASTTTASTATTGAVAHQDNQEDTAAKAQALSDLKNSIPNHLKLKAYTSRGQGSLAPLLNADDTTTPSSNILKPKVMAKGAFSRLMDLLESSLPEQARASIDIAKPTTYEEYLQMRREETLAVQQSVSYSQDHYFKEYMAKLRTSNDFNPDYAFDKLKFDKLNYNALNFSQQFVHNMDKHLNASLLLLLGGPGSGKTVVCHAIAQMFIKLKSKGPHLTLRRPDLPMVILTSFNEISALKMGVFNDNTQERSVREQRFEELCNVDLLIIDDLCEDTSALSPFAQKVLAELLSIRRDQNIPVVIATPVSNIDIADKVGIRSFERINSFNVIATCLEGASRRPRAIRIKRWDGSTYDMPPTQNSSNSAFKPQATSANSQYKLSHAVTQPKANLEQADARRNQAYFATSGTTGNVNSDNYRDSSHGETSNTIIPTLAASAQNQLQLKPNDNLEFKSQDELNTRLGKVEEVDESELPKLNSLGENNEQLTLASVPPQESELQNEDTEEFDWINSGLSPKKATKQAQFEKLNTPSLDPNSLNAFPEDSQDPMLSARDEFYKLANIPLNFIGNNDLQEDYGQNDTNFNEIPSVYGNDSGKPVRRSKHGFDID